MNKREKAMRLVNSARQYNAYSIRYGIVEKTFNHGCGSLSCIRFTDGNEVVINTAIFNSFDRKHVERLFKDNGLGTPSFTKKELGYPDWYFKSL